MTNPYRWDSPRLDAPVVRAEWEALAAVLLRGGTACVYAGHGMGKSVLTRWLERRLADSATVVRLDRPEERRLRDEVVARLELPVSTPLDVALRGRLGAGGRAVLLIDEVDRWVEHDAQRLFVEDLDALAAVSRDEIPGQLGVMALGGVRHALQARSPWGSGFTTRVTRTVWLEPMSASELRELARPLWERHPTMNASGFLDELRLASGGIPALAAYALQHAWDEPSALPQRLLTDFVERQRGFQQGVLGALAGPDGLRAPLEVMALVARAEQEGRDITWDELLPLCKEPAAPDLVVDVLKASGLVAADANLDETPPNLRRNPSVLRVARQPHPRRDSPIDALWEDLRAACLELRRHAADLHQGAGAERNLLPEAAFSAMLAMALTPRGWRVLRETQQGQGRTDLWVEGRGALALGGHAVVEVKRWGNQDLPSVCTQVGGYVTGPRPWTGDGPTVATAIVIVGKPVLDEARVRSAVADLPAGDGVERAGVREWLGRLPVPDLPCLWLTVGELG